MNDRRTCDSTQIVNKALTTARGPRDFRAPEVSHATVAALSQKNTTRLPRHHGANRETATKMAKHSQVLISASGRPGVGRPKAGRLGNVSETKAPAQKAPTEGTVARQASV
jgi:hypothetical protein